jgi:cytochrome c556
MKMKKSLMVILLALAGTVAGMGSAAAQCKIDDIYEKYRINERFNSVNMSKEMLTLVASQRNSERIKEDVKNISSVKILSVKVPSSKKYSSYGFSTNGDGMAYFDGEAFSASLNESLSQSLSSINESSTNVSKEQKEEIEKNVKEKMVQKQAELKKRQEEKQAELKSRQEAKQAEFQKKQDEIKALMEQVVKDANSCIEASKYSELMSVNEDGKLVKYFAKMEAEKIKEFVVVTKSSREYSLIIIHGDDIKIQSVSRLGMIIPNADIDTEYLY